MPNNKHSSSYFFLLCLATGLFNLFTTAFSSPAFKIKLNALHGTSSNLSFSQVKIIELLSMQLIDFSNSPTALHKLLYWTTTTNLQSAISPFSWMLGTRIIIILMLYSQVPSSDGSLSSQLLKIADCLSQRDSIKVWQIATYFTSTWRWS